MEILKVFFEAHLVTPSVLAAGDSIQVNLQDRSRAVMAELSEAGIIARLLDKFDVITTGGSHVNQVHCIDLTDNGGKGILYGKKELILAIQGLSLPSVGEAHVAILYRLIRVSVTEMIGVLQD